MIRSVCIVLISLLSRHAVAQQAWIRINQLGYAGSDVKVAVLVAKEQRSLTHFTLVDAGTGKSVWSGPLSSSGAYAAFQQSWRLDFSSFSREGVYYLEAGGVKSPGFRIQNRVYNGTADFILKYMRQQRSGYNPFLKDSCHRQDGFIVYHKDRSKDSTYIDVSGGWHDASDYLQYLPTSANATYQMLFAYTQNPQSFSDHYDARGNEGANQIPDIIDEAKWGLDWLVKMNPGKEEYYNQLADDRDHSGLRLPTQDSVKYGPGKGLSRPVYFITGQPQGGKYKNKTKGVASSAGKFASAFALGAIVMKEFYPAFARTLIAKAKDAYAFGRLYPGNTQTLSVKAPYIYAEDNDADDMELAALSIYQLTKQKKYLDEAIQYARVEPVTPWMGADSANHYQWYPFVNLGHYWGARLDPDHRDEYISFMKQGIDKVVARGKGTPFLNGVPFIWCSNNLVAGILTQMHLYKKLTGDQRYSMQEAALRDWLLGCNPWGTSMICDLPETGVAPKDPHSAFTYLYKYKISGGLVDGPVYGSIWNKLIGIKLYAEDEFKEFQSNLVVYHDDFGDYSTNEPTMDGTASLSYYLSSLQDNRNLKEVRDAEGAVIKLNPDKKKIYFLFSAHEFGEGGTRILDALKANGVKGSFFLTGDFIRNKVFKNIVHRIVREGHYLGSHSDRHLLYADWNKRDSLLVTRDSFQCDLDRSLLELKKVGAGKGRWYLPPYEWYNKETVRWCKTNGLEVINFTPGTGTNADYTWPDLFNYRSSDSIQRKLWEREQQQGLNGNMILVHLGTDPRRKDKLYNHLTEMIIYLKKMGYSIARLP
ncbi:glycoside hydrolase family 9 protein [Niabella yanshanensis]|uniref:Glycoside hydrolase family 9 protein n=1 Tax=Niabella yanshanensis TaxID=577386 RepID=A0ABZ0W5J2_9BACT|nr:glycoside hydrolase family 9 protein [Niabella yanshanensis]WQD37782.1 glycoside hydrolase family 9 protein [Niabella yanshanensis]